MAESSSQIVSHKDVVENGDDVITPEQEKEAIALLKRYYTQLYVEKLELEKMLADSHEAALSEAVLNMMNEERNNNNLTMIGDLPSETKDDDKQVLDQMKNIEKFLSGQEDILKTLISNVDREIHKYRVDQSVLIKKSDVDSIPDD